MANLNITANHGSTMWNIESISGFLYGHGSSERVRVAVKPIFDIDSGTIEPKLGDFGGGRPIHKAVVKILDHQILIYSWNVPHGDLSGVNRNIPVSVIRPSTHFHGEILAFSIGSHVPFLKNHQSIPKNHFDNAIGCYVTRLLDSQEGKRVLPTYIEIDM